MNYNIVQGTEEINSIGGISLVGKMLNNLKSFKFINDLQPKKVKNGTISHNNILKSMIALFTLGKTDYADINLYKKDIVFKESLRLFFLPSEETLRLRLDDIAGVLGDEMKDVNIEHLKKTTDYGQLELKHNSYTPVPMDVTVLNNEGSSKENVSMTYKGYEGFAPMHAYIGTDGYFLNCELREGKQHSQNGMIKFLDQTLDMLDELNVHNPLIVLDSAHDAAENINLFQERNQSFIIKQNIRQQPIEQYLALARRVGDCKEPREGKKVYTGVLSHLSPSNYTSSKPLFTVFEITERTIDSKGEPLLFPRISCNLWWTSIPDEALEVIYLYHQQGTSEQFHSELKSDMGIERLPSNKFLTNSLILQLGMIAFNILRSIGQNMLTIDCKKPIKIKIKRRRLRNVIQDLIYIACKRVNHSNKLTLKFGKSCPWFEVFRLLYLKL